MRAFSKYAIVLVAIYLATWTASYAAMFVSQGDTLDFSHYFEYFRLAWTFRGGELPSYIWLSSLIAFLPLAGVSVFLLRRREKRKNSLV
jgi:hypothetical protein